MRTATIEPVLQEATSHRDVLNVKGTQEWKPPGFMKRSFQAALHSKLKTLKNGGLILQDGPCVTCFGDVPEQGLTARIMVQNQRFYQRLALGGVLGAADSYLDGDWEVDDLTSLFRILAQNLDSAETINGPVSVTAQRIARLKHFLARNSVRGSRKNIEAHYDLGDDFFRLFLDPTLMYSSAIFEHDEMNLEEAQVARLDRICRKLNLRPDDQVIEIGTGWGGFALYAARNYGCHVTTTTISENQFRTARDRIAKAGLSDRVTLLKQDYRDLTGKYDKLVSIEMIEAVGHSYFDTFFRQCGNLLNDQGKMLLQAIVMPEQRYEKYLKSVDFIQKYIFPGGCLPSVVRMQQSVASQTDMRLHTLDDFAPHYARTLREWRKRFHRNLNEIRQLGYSERFLRMWDYYFCYCEAAFDERAVGVVQAVWGK